MVGMTDTALLITVKIKQRINAALKCIAQLEAHKELNAFVGDYHDNDSV